MPREQRRARSERTGLSLIEVLVAIVVLTTGALAAVSTQVATAHLAKHARALHVNAQDAARLLDSLRPTPCVSAAGANVGKYADYSWSKSVSGGVARIHLLVTPTTGKPWSAETLVPCP